MMLRSRPPGPSPARHRAAHLLAALVALLVAIGLPTTPSASAATPTTVVSLTFDDSTADHRDAARILQSHGMAGTFYVISGYVGQPGYLTREDLARLAAAGNEIGGHTVDHADLGMLDVDEARREMCVDRRTLQGWGLHPTSFAYPYSSYDQTTAQLAVECGYNSARALGDIRSKTGCPECDVAETIPPEKPFQLRAADNVDPSWTVADLQTLVLNAERAGGGWVPMVFHQICDGCSEYGMRPQILDEFTAWLAGRAERGTVVRTVGQVVGGTEKPVPADVGFGRPAVTPANPGLEQVGTSGGPECWDVKSTGQGDVTATLVDRAHTGSRAMRLDLRNHRNGDTKLLPRMDLGTCAPPAGDGRAYLVAVWYRSDVRVQFAAYTRDATGRWSYWTSSPFFQPGGGWTEARWTTPTTPPGSTGVSYGLSLQDDGFVETDDYAMAEATVPAAVPPPAPPITPAGYAVIGVVALALLWWSSTRVAQARSRRKRAGLDRWSGATATEVGTPVATDAGPSPSGSGATAR